MTKIPMENGADVMSLQELVETAARTLPKRQPRNCPPAIPPSLQLKWGLALLGEDKAHEYLEWFTRRLDTPHG